MSAPIPQTPNTGHKNPVRLPGAMLSAKFLSVLLVVPVLLVGIHLLKKNFPEYPELLTFVQIVAVLVMVFGVYRTLLSAVLPLLSERLGAERVRSARYFLDFLFIVLMMLAALTLLGKGFQNLAIGGTVLSAVFGIAAQNSLSNFFSGFILAIVQPFKVGDAVALVTWQFTRMAATYRHDTLSPEYSGTIVEIGMVHTKLEGSDGRVFLIPNAIVLQAMIFERGKTPGVLSFSIELPSGVPLSKFETCVETALSVRGENKSPSFDLKLSDVGSDSYVVSITLRNSSLTEQEARDLILREMLAPETGKSPAPSENAQ